MALSLHQALGLHWASPVVLRYQTADSFIRPRDDTAVFRTASGTQGRTVSVSGAPPWTTTTPSARCGGGVVNGSVRVGLRLMAANGLSGGLPRWSVALLRALRDVSRRNRHARAHTPAARTTAPHRTFVGAGTTMDDAVPRHRWRQAFGCEGER